MCQRRCGAAGALPDRRVRSRGAKAWALVLLLATAGPSPARLAAAEDQEKVLPPKEVTLKTDDDWTLVATYYPSKLGKDAVPVVLLHASKGSRGDFEELAVVLQRAGHAVIAPDLRGHGDSAGSGDERITDLRPADYQVMDSQDVESVKRFLLAKNNAGELNIEKLCLVGVEMGAVLAINFAARDWSWPLLATGKQGQDVKALVLISPEWSFKGLRINEAIANPNVRSDLSIMIIAGKGAGKSLREAKRLHTTLERYHPAPAPEAAADKQTLWLRTPATSLQGMQLLNEKSMHVDQMVSKFIELRLVKKPMPWSDRKSLRE
jgi:pimeloyl-ACP methyl ester carboxylesterase